MKLGLVGTNSARSTNRKLLQYIEQHFADKADIELVEIKELPIFNKPANRELPETVKRIGLKKLRYADGVIIGTPEYDHSLFSCPYECPLGIIRCLSTIKQTSYA